MNKYLILLVVIVVSIIIIFKVIKDNLQNNIIGNLKSLNIDNLVIEATPLVDIFIGFEVVNNSFFNININGLVVDIYDTETSKKIASSKTVSEVRFNRGITEHEISLPRVSVLNGVNVILNEKPLMVVISFYFMFIKIEFNQEIN